MECLSPISIPKPNGYSAKDRITVPCARCYACLSNQRADWTFRLLQELKVAKTAHFITLTYNDENILYGEEGKQTLWKPDLQAFIKRLREQQRRLPSKVSIKNNILLESLKNEQIRYYAVGEYGTQTKRPHYHAIIFNVDNSLIDKTDKIWQKGNVQIGGVSIASIHYTTKYLLTKHELIEGVEKPFATMSRRPAIGSIYVERNKVIHRKSSMNYVTSNGVKQRMPRHFKDKIFSPLEKEVLALQSKEISEKTRDKRFEKFKKKGLDPFKHQVTLKEDRRRSINRLINKGEKL